MYAMNHSTQQVMKEGRASVPVFHPASTLDLSILSLS